MMPTQKYLCLRRHRYRFFDYRQVYQKIRPLLITALTLSRQYDMFCVRYRFNELKADTYILEDYQFILRDWGYLVHSLLTYDYTTIVKSGKIVCFGEKKYNKKTVTENQLQVEKILRRMGGELRSVPFLV